MVDAGTQFFILKLRLIELVENYKDVYLCTGIRTKMIEL